MDTVQAVAVGQAMAANKSAAEWQAYARRLEQELRLATAENFGYAAVRDAAVAQLAKLDPHNYLLVQSNRRRIFENARDAQLAGKRAA